MVSESRGSTAILEPGTNFETVCEDTWANVDLESEGSVRASGIEFVSEALDCFLSMDFINLVKSTREYNWVSPQVQIGGPAHAFDWGAMSHSMVIAESCCNLRLFEQAYNLVEACLGMLNEAGNPRANTHLRLWTLRVIAKCKWQQSFTTRNKLWSPEWMCQEYESKYQRVIAILKREPHKDKDGLTVTSLETTGFALLKLAVCYLPDELPRMVADFNSRWGTNLGVEDRYFKSIEPCQNKAFLHWDFEIAKLWINGSLTLEELDYCHAQLIQAANDELEGDINGYLLSLELQYRYMAQKFTDILEFSFG